MELSNWVKKWYFYNIPIALYAYFDIKFWNSGIAYYKNENNLKI